jgi:hypothetical protein
MNRVFVSIAVALAALIVVFVGVAPTHAQGITAEETSVGVAEVKSSLARTELARIAARGVRTDKKGFEVRHTPGWDWKYRVTEFGYDPRGTLWQRADGKPAFVYDWTTKTFAISANYWIRTAEGYLGPQHQWALKSAGLTRSAWLPLPGDFGDDSAGLSLDLASPAFGAKILSEVAETVSKRTRGKTVVYSARTDEGVWQVTTKSGRIVSLATGLDVTTYLSRGVPAPVPFGKVQAADTTLVDQGGWQDARWKFLGAYGRGKMPKQWFTTKREGVQAVQRSYRSMADELNLRFEATGSGAIVYFPRDDNTPDFVELWYRVDVKQMKNGKWQAVDSRNGSLKIP